MSTVMNDVEPLSVDDEGPDGYDDVTTIQVCFFAISPR